MRTRTRPKYRLSSAAVFLAAGLLGSFLASTPAQASDWRWGFGVGYGGEGITTVATKTEPVVDRADGPFMLEVSLDKFVSDTWMLTLSHSRGLSAAPFSSGESFTGLSANWFFLGPPPVIAPDMANTTLSVRRWTPFAGISSGLAQASISRDNSPVPTASGSGLFLGTRLGFDYPTGPGRGWRPELIYSSTSFLQSFSKSPSPPPTLEQFSLQFSWYFDF